MHDRLKFPPRPLLRWALCGVLALGLAPALVGARNEARNEASSGVRKPAHPSTWDGVTTRVLDGDSLWFAPLQQGQRLPALQVRLARIDAPEICQAHGTESRRALAELVLDKAGRLQGVARDSHGRLVAHLRLDGVDVATRLVEEGHAWSARQRNDHGPLVKQERMARALTRGLHAQPGAVMPRDFRRSHGPCPAGAAR